MTNQQIYDKVKKHLLRQGKKSMKKFADGLGEYCAYRGDSGLRCAIGCLIPDRAYSPRMEGSRVDSSRIEGKLKDLGIIEAGQRSTLDLLEGLQNIHDDYPPSRWASCLRVIARRNGLKP